MYSTDLKSIYPVKICQNLIFRAKFTGIWQKPGQICKLREFYHNKTQKTYAAMEPWVACNH
jgi:hypothetical protein